MEDGERKENRKVAYDYQRTRCIPGQELISDLTIKESVVCFERFLVTGFLRNFTTGFSIKWLEFVDDKETLYGVDSLPTRIKCHPALPACSQGRFE